MMSHVPKLAWKPEAKDQIEKITANNILWNQYITELEAFKKVPSQLNATYWIEKITSATILPHTFMYGTPGYKFIKSLWEWKFDMKTSTKTVAILNQIEGLIIGGYLTFQTCLGCGKIYEDCQALCEHLRLHLRNVDRCKGREFDDIHRERAGMRQLHCIRCLLRDGKLTRFGSFPTWMLFKQPYSGTSLPLKPNQFSHTTKRLGTLSSLVNVSTSVSQSSHVKNLSSGSPHLQQMVPSLIHGGAPPSHIQLPSHAIAHPFVVTSSSVKPSSSGTDHLIKVSPQIKPRAIDATHHLQLAPSRVQSLGDGEEHVNQVAHPLKREAMHLLPAPPPHIKPPLSGAVPVTEAPLKRTPLDANPVNSRPPFLHKVASSSNVKPATSGLSLLLQAPDNTNKRKADALESHSKKAKLHSILKVQNPSSGLSLLIPSSVHTKKRKADTLESNSKKAKLHSILKVQNINSNNTGLDPFLRKVPSSSNVKPANSGLSLLLPSSIQTDKRKPDASEPHSNTGLDPQTGHYTPKTVSVISKHINVHGPSDRVESAIDKFKKIGEDNQNEKKLTSLDILEKVLLESKEVASDNHENKPLWTTLDEKMESPSFDWENEEHYPHFLANWVSLHDCVAKATEHGRVCRGDLEPTVGGLHSPGFTNKECTYRCTWCKFSYSLRPSPRFQNRGVSDLISAFSSETCGGMKSNIERHYETLQMSSPVKSKFLNETFNIDLLRKITKSTADEVKNKALQECLVKNDGNVRLKIDMAHQNRTNSGSSTLTGMDTSTNDILFVCNKHRSDEPVSQKHESGAADDMCELIRRLELLLQVAITDKGSSAQRVIKQYFPDCIIQWDNWHALKGLERALKALFEKDEAFEDKIKKIRGHVYWSLKNHKLTVEEYLDPEKRRVAQENIQQSILQLCRHFQGAVPDDVDCEGVKFHADCNVESRCQRNENYVNTKVVLTTSEADDLKTFLEKTDFIRNTDKFLLDLNTSNVESTHRTQNIYRDKSNHLSEEMYNFCIDLSTLHSQEMIDGKYENGERIHEKELSRGPIGNPKKECSKRFFMKDLMGRYFSEIGKPNSDDDGELNDQNKQVEKDQNDSDEKDFDTDEGEDESDTDYSTSEEVDSNSDCSMFDVADLSELAKSDNENIHVRSHPT